MLLAFAKKLRGDLAKLPIPEVVGPNALGTLTESEPYEQLRYGEIEGIGTVTIDRTGNMAGYSPVERCKDKQGEIAWIPTELVRNMRLEPFPVAQPKNLTKESTK